MEECFPIQDKELLEKYPDIKELRKLPPGKVAYYCHKGMEPEWDAWETLIGWVKKHNLDKGEQKLRYFGFDNPPPASEGEEYGYEVWVTIGDDIEVDDEKVQAKQFEGGLFAVTSTTVQDVFSAWINLGKWLEESTYSYREHIPCLEELLSYGEEAENIKLVLYLPVKEN